MDLEPLLSRDEELALARAIELGRLARAALDEPRARRVLPPATPAELERLVAEGGQARQRFMAANIRLAAWAARRWADREALDVEDLVQEACVGLAKAVDRWDHRSGVRFASYAVHWLDKSLRAAAANRCGELPISAQDGLALRRGLRDETHRRTLRAIAGSRSLFTDDGMLPLPVPEPVTDDATVHSALAALTPAELRLVLLRHGWDGSRPLGLREAGRRLGIGWREAERLERRALARMRTAVGAEDAVA